MSDQVLDQVTDQRGEDSRNARANRAARRFNNAVLAVFCLLLGGFAVLAIFYLVCWTLYDEDHVWPVCAKLGFNSTRDDGSRSDGSGYS